MKKRILLIALIGVSFGIKAQNTFPTNGNVGIGTTNPTSQLNVGTSTTNSPSTIAQFGTSVTSGEARVLSLVNSGGGSNQSTSLDFHNGAAWSPTGKIQVQQLGTDTKSKLHFFTYNSGLKNRMTINENGYVGIGTSNPTSQLNIGTSTTNSPSTIAQFGTSVTSGEARVLSLVNSGGGSNQSTSLDFHNGAAWSPTGKIQVQQLGTDTKSKLHFFTYNSGLKNRMTINENGYVGIGTSNPTSQLNIGTSTTNSPSTIAQFGTSVTSGEARVLSLVNSGGGSNQSTSLDFHNGAAWSPTGKIQVQQLGTDTKSKLHFFTYNNGLKNRMTINENGYVGIGTSNPTSQLNIGTSTTNSPSTIAQFGTSVTSGEARVLSLVNSGGGSNQSTSLDFHNGAAWSPTGKIQVQQLGTDTKSKLHFFTYNNGLKNRMTINENGYVGIGTINPDSELAVNGKIHTKEVKVDLIGWSDFVFENDYKLPTLAEVEQHIKDKGHLKDIPSAENVKENGILLGKMDSKLLQKIEELTLYTIEQEKRLNSIDLKNETLEKENEILKALATKFLELQKRLEKLEKK